LTNIEQHLRLRNFLVGHQLTLADALLVSILSVCFELVFDKKVRKASLPHVSRYTQLLLQMPAFVSVFGQVMFCKDAVAPQFGK
jgi:glutathione S-transferase